jgi:Ulp1 family protease
LEPLQYPTSIYLICAPKHYVTLAVDRQTYYFYDSLKTKAKLRVPVIVNKIHEALRTWYEDIDKKKPIVLQPPTAKTIKEKIPLQEDVWSCDIHALMVALATIYQGKKHVL